ncbi:metal-dependent hydrolase [Candidatus Woesearchaeota archaeon]|nr:metal-dependent hydrolase [Candidatus Woesearchaeota archaeon]
MMGRTHMAIGFLVGLLVLPFVQPDNSLLFVFLVTFASLWPDVDHENSKINRLLPITRWIPRVFVHRGFFHSVFPALILYGVFWYFGLAWIGLPLALGYLTHLASDCLTRLGCNLLHPVSTFRIQGFVWTDGLVEFALFGVVVVLDVVVGVMRFF